MDRTDTGLNVILRDHLIEIVTIFFIKKDGGISQPRPQGLPRYGARAEEDPRIYQMLFGFK